MNEKDYFQMHTEWLRFKSCLYDMNTGLPVLPLVIEDIRKLSDDYGKVVVIYIDITKDIESLYGWQMYDKLIRQTVNSISFLKKEILPENTIITLTGVRSGEILLFLSTDKNGNILSNDEVEMMEKRIKSKIENELPGWEPNYIFATKVFRIGYSFFTKSPTRRMERTIFQAIDKARRIIERQKEESRLDRDLNLEYIIANNEIRTVYQPIIDLKNGDVLGYEALSRITNDSFLSNSEILFSYAVETDMLLDLERICRTNAVVHLPEKLNGRLLFLNSSAKGIYDPEFKSKKFENFLEEHYIPKENVVIEITEKLAVTDYQSFNKSVRILKDKGFKIAIDDMGAGYSSLRTISELKPNFLKYDMALIRDIHKNLIKKDLLETLIPFTERLGAEIIAEGIETEDEFETLKSIGIKYGQGFFIAMPENPFPKIKVKN
ncbi:MAG: Diguanylate cyclase/phosphodiesterase [candidate division TA06 bacterium 32_111]|uniref:Diguanylate cyclase/phosphodiesterase n=2 Tax=Bacteria candidate phyla TaxID=1783234 RepID=A0A101I0I2_UNCT6|nr:MAG: Diguanylate cyclase/phosphodiesterase [candidate division TA06 bacterium 32_111]KUK86781.1 MAG: Diguanylate cyclase/phosphodiesterase [candidate division TA06 bacterium 34_109]HAF08317.1 hypothetical protein [candidate division WOR-3 bacterium]HCP16571.1 hypothetical protein [candidate division WOR-3 bacterium]